MVKLTLIVIALATAGAAGVAAAQAGLSHERAGLGFKPSRDTALLPADPTFGGESSPAWHARHPRDFVLYSGARELPRPGLRSVESYSGVFRPLSETWGSSIETGVVRETWFTPRRYSLGGQLHTALSDARSLSVGLKLRVHASAATPLAAAVEPPGALGGGHAPGTARLYGATPGSSYQLQMSYQYSAAGAFGLALGRELETYTSYFDAPGNGPSQLTFTGQHWLTPSWALSYDVLSSDSGNSFRLHSLRLGVRYRF